MLLRPGASGADLKAEAGSVKQFAGVENISGCRWLGRVGEKDDPLFRSSGDVLAKAECGHT